MKAMSIRSLTLAAAAALALISPATAQQTPPVTLDVLPGWRTDGGVHVVGLRFTLESGWKTYWRAPGDAGIPPIFDWSGSDNLAGTAITWPAPFVFDQNGMRSVGYKDSVILPVALTPRQRDGEIRLSGVVDIGVCRDICIPETLRFDAVLPAAATRPDPRIAAAIAARPYSAEEAGVSHVACSFGSDGGRLTLQAAIAMPPLGGDEHVVVETGDPDVWIAEAATRRSGVNLLAETELVHIDGTMFALDRSELRITVIGADQAVEIMGCPAP